MCHLSFGLWIGEVCKRLKLLVRTYTLRKGAVLSTIDFDYQLSTTNVVYYCLQLAVLLLFR